MSLLTGFLSYLGQFLIYAALAVGGVLLGKKLREKKDRKNAANKGEE
ncbi:MAG: hypothetical protein IJR36_01770 [Lachnospiraceae bacterium]|nr:hypothetical protein [Lachnospiraceae bacterium]MBQ9562719.1 hypothetical protein [Lachnospiraceae bacterium]MBQ9592584.1 hypothetical protein [Lachnospiraceae bacterium]MBR0152663.1 hypothetical protein [Lachnospiraceae bacterium]